MKQNILNSIGLLTIIIVFVFTNIFARSAILELYPDLSNGVIAFLSYTITSLLTVIYILIIKRACGIYVPSMRPEIRKLNPRLIVLGFIMIVAMSIVLGPLMEMLPSEYLDIMDKYMNNGLWAMVVAVVVAPIFEEFVFRGVVQTNLIKYYDVIPGIVVGSVVFGLMHVIPQQVVNATGVGLILGSIYYITGSLNTVIAIHFINNGFAYLLFMLFSDTSKLEKVILANETVYIVTYAASLIMLILGGAYVIKWAKREKFEKLQKK